VDLAANGLVPFIDTDADFGDAKKFCEEPVTLSGKVVEQKPW
jgi:hypothetical protein